MKNLFVFIVCVISGCASIQEEIVDRVEFPTNEYQQLQTEGTATVEGQVFLRTNGGDVKYGAGSPVWLNPKTSYSDQWVKIQTDNNYRTYGYGLKVLRKPTTAQESILKKHIITTQADGFGNFKLENVPSGEYYLVSGVTWQVNGSAPQGGYVIKLISIQKESKIKVMLTR